MSIELDMWLLLKKAKYDEDEEVDYWEQEDRRMKEMERKEEMEEPWDEEKEQEKEYFGDDFNKIVKLMEHNDLHENQIKNIGHYQSLPSKSGSWRTAIFLSDDFVIKLAHNKHGRILNQRESELSPNIFPKVYKYYPDFRWIVVEQAKSPRRIHQYFPELGDLYLEDYFRLINLTNPPMYEYQEWKKAKNIKPGPHLKKFIDFFNFYPQASIDFGDKNLGIVNRNGEDVPVMVDSGLHGDLVPGNWSVKEEMKDRLEKQKRYRCNGGK